jgi:CNT family concentrative nucleoside transporter
LFQFVAYEALGAAMHAGTIDPRSAMLATYGLCGFSNLASIGVLLGGLSPLIPHRSKEIAGMCGRAIVGGTLTCCLTGCVAGFVIQSVDFPTPPPAAVATA